MSCLSQYLSCCYLAYVNTRESPAASVPTKVHVYAYIGYINRTPVTMVTQDREYKQLKHTWCIQTGSCAEEIQFHIIKQCLYHNLNRGLSSNEISEAQDISWYNPSLHLLTKQVYFLLIRLNGTLPKLCTLQFKPIVFYHVSGFHTNFIISTMPALFHVYYDQ